MANLVEQLLGDSGWPEVSWGEDGAGGERHIREGQSFSIGVTATCGSISLLGYSTGGEADFTLYLKTGDTPGEGSTLETISFNSNVFPSGGAGDAIWVKFSFSGIVLEEGNSYHLIIRKDALAEEFRGPRIFLGYADYNPYEGGSWWRWLNTDTGGADSWVEHIGSDLAFIIGPGIGLTPTPAHEATGILLYPTLSWEVA